MAESQLLESYNAKVLLKSGEQTLELTETCGLVVSDGWLTDWVTIYDFNGTWVHSGVLTLNKPIKQMLDTIALTEYKKLKED